MIKFWSDRKSKIKHISRNMHYFTDILNKLICAFEYSNVPDGIDVKYMESYLIFNGCVGIAPFEGGYVAIEGCGSDKLNNYGVAQSYVGTIQGDKARSFEFNNNESGIIIYNNTVKMPSYPLIERYSSMLADIEESMEQAIINSRIVPIPVVDNDTTKRQVEEAQRRIKEGSVSVVVAPNILDSDDKVRRADLTDSNMIGKLQYYSRFYEDTLKRLWVELGIEISNKDKAAQVSEGELYSYKEYSRVSIEDMLACRREGLNRFNGLYGTNWSVKLNKHFNGIEEREEVEEEVEDELTEEGVQYG